jgi:hypothetical protein
MRHLLATALLTACTTTTGTGTTAAPSTICPGPDLFSHAVCACEDFSHVGEIRVLAGAAGPGSIGVNGKTELVASAAIAGSFDAFGGLESVGASVGDSLHTAGDVELTGSMSIANDASIGGNLEAVGELDIGGTLGVAGTSAILGTSAIAARGNYTPAAKPCGCDPATEFSVAGAVASAKLAAAGGTSWDSAAGQDLHLPTGNYYVTSAQIVGTTTIHIEGKASVFVDGSLATVGATQWQLAAGAELDLFVAGSVESVGSLTAGDPARAAAFRLYLGGDQSDLDIVGSGDFAGTIYAPTAAVHHVGDLHVAGSLFARTVEGVGKLTVEYATPLSPPTSCDADPQF